MHKTPPLSPSVLDLIPPLRDSSAPAGFLVDASGIRTRRSNRGGDANAPGVVQHRAPSSSWEWIPLAWAVMTAGERFAAVELGAGWGPWISRAYALARRMGIAERRIFGVEAEPAHFAYMRRHMADNAIPDSDTVLVQGLIAQSEGVALFPLTDTPEQSWGLRQMGREGATREEVLERAGAVPIPAEPGLFRLPRSPHKYAVQESVTLQRLIGETEMIDFMHVDIQGSEGTVLPAAMDLLNERVRLLAVGTHSHEIEAKLRDCFGANGWVCHHDTEMHRRANGSLADGHQVWRNPRLGPEPGVAEVVSAA